MWATYNSYLVVIHMNINFSTLYFSVVQPHKNSSVRCICTFCFHFFVILLFAVPLTDDTFSKWRTDFYKCEKNVLAQNVCSRIDPFEAALSRKVLENTQHVFNYKVESEGKPLTNQKNSGRCWLFATLNSIRIPFIKNVSEQIKKFHKFDTFDIFAIINTIICYSTI